MPDCTSCPSSNKGKPAPICIYCRGPYSSNPHGETEQSSPNNHGKTHVSVEEVADFVPAPVTTESSSDYDGAIHFIRALCGMGMINREILFNRLMDLQYPEIAKYLNRMLKNSLTTQAVHARAKKALTDPAFKELFREMIAKQHRRNGTGTARKNADNFDDRINLLKLPDLLAWKAECEARIQSIRGSNTKDDKKATAKLIQSERRRITALDLCIVECWKFPHKINLDV